MKSLYQKILLLFNYFKTLFGSRFKSRAALESWQEIRIQNHVRWVLKNAPFYNRLAPFEPNRWRELPIMDKTQMMENFSELNTRGIRKFEAMKIALDAEQTRDFKPELNGVTIGLSSGTSGHRGIFLASSDERWKYLGTILAKILPDSLFRHQRIAFFLRANSNLYSNANSKLMEFKFFDLLHPLDQHLAQLNEFQPTLLFGPPSLLRQLAEATNAKQLKIEPRRIFSVAEVLDPSDQAVIEKHFRQGLHQIYQCTEGFLGFTCQAGTLHLNEDLVHIEREYLDFEQRKFVPIITDFTRKTQPILRYRLNDILTERKNPCPCGSVLLALEQIEGRCDDLIYLEKLSLDGYTPVFPDFIRRSILFASAEIQEYRVVQLETGSLQISLRCEEGLRAAISQKIELEIRALASQLQATAPEILFTGEFEALGLRKLRRVERRFQLWQSSSKT